MSKDKLWTQASLQTAEAETMTTWLDKPVKKGQLLRLKDDDRKWFVMAVYETRELHEIDNRGWDNNNYDKHVGLGL